MNTAALLYSFGIHNYAHYGLIKNSLVKSIIQQLLSSLNVCLILPIVECILFPPVCQELAFLGIQVKEDVTLVWRNLVQWKLLAQYVRVCLASQSCLTLCHPLDCSPPGTSVHCILQARTLEWVAIFSSRDLPNPGITSTSLASPALAGRFFATEPPGKPYL